MLRHRIASRRRLALVAALFLAPITATRAQTAAERAPWGLFSARYDTHTSDFIYALYGYGKSFAMVGTLQNPRSGWTELVGALGRNFTPFGGPTQSVATGVARAGDEWYAQAYFVPTARVGPAWLRATAEWDFPIANHGTTQFALSPVSLTIPTVRHVETGMSMDLAAARGARTSIALGPEIRVALPGATIGTDLQRMTDGSTSRLRLFFLTQF